MIRTLGHHRAFRATYSQIKPIYCNTPTRRRSSSKSENRDDIVEVIKPHELNKIESHKFCMIHVRKYDRENYLAALFINDPLFRRAIIALRAFNVELSLVRDSTTNSDRAKLRFNFWAKLIDEIQRRNTIQTDYYNVDKLNAYYNYTPVAKELLEVFQLIKMDSHIRDLLDDLIGARISSKVLGYKAFETLDELELYCSKSNSSLYHLGWLLGRQLHDKNRILGNEQLQTTTNYEQTVVANLKSMSDNLGMAHGLSNIIRGIPYNSTKNCCYMPKDILEEHNLTNRDFVTTPRKTSLEGEKIAPVVKCLSLKCQKMLDHVIELNLNIPNYFRSMFLSRIAIQSNLNRLKKCNYNICHPSIGRQDTLLPLNLWMASRYWRAPIL